MCPCGITELTQKAEISKATFYLHYHDIFDLSEKLKQEMIQAVFARLEDPMEILTDSISFMGKMVAALYQQMHGMPLREMDKVIYAVCDLCRDHERSGFAEGIKIGIRLAEEIE